jgi:hypothetical protein
MCFLSNYPRRIEEGTGADDSGFAETEEDVSTFT